MRTNQFIASRYTFNYFANQASYYLAWSNHRCSITQQRIFLSKEFLANSYNTTATHKDDRSLCTKCVPRTGNVSLQSTTDRRCPVASLQRTSLSELGIQNHFLRRDYTSSMRPHNKGGGVNWVHLAGLYIGGSILRTSKD